MVARDADEAAALERELGFRAQLGVPMTRLRPSEARRLEPALAPTLRLALEAPDDHVADPRLLAPALAEAARRAGAVLRTGAEVARRAAATTSTLADGEVDPRGRRRRRRGRLGGRARPASPSARSRARSSGCAIPRAPACSSASCAGRAATSCRAATDRYVLGATMEDKGFDTTGHRGRRVRAAARRVRAGPRRPRARAGGDVRRAAADDARQHAAHRPQRAHGPRLRGRAPPQRRAARVDHRRPRRRRARRRRAARPALAPDRFAVREVVA